MTATAIGFAFDAGSGHRELGTAFSACYAIGCVLAVLAVQQAGVFTAVIQSPLILFVCVPGAYFLFHGGKLTGLRDMLINLGYPLIERFPLMFFTSTAVLLIGMARWYHGMSTQRGTTKTAANTAAKTGLMSMVTSKVSAFVTRVPVAEKGEAPDGSRSRHSIDRPRRAAKTAKTARAAKAAGGTTRAARRPTKRAAPPQRSRHARPPETEIIEAVVDRPRRPRSARRAEPPVPPPAEPRRRPRNQSVREPRRQPPVDTRAAYERPRHRHRLDDYEQPPEPRGTNGDATHHPISRVRYRSVDEDENRAEYRTRPRQPRDWDAEAWEYDV